MIPDSRLKWLSACLAIQSWSSRLKHLIAVPHLFCESASLHIFMEKFAIIRVINATSDEYGLFVLPRHTRLHSVRIGVRMPLGLVEWNETSESLLRLCFLSQWFIIYRSPRFGKKWELCVVLIYYGPSCWPRLKRTFIAVEWKQNTSSDGGLTINWPAELFALFTWPDPPLFNPNHSLRLPRFELPLIVSVCTDCNTVFGRHIKTKRITRRCSRRWKRKKKN